MSTSRRFIRASPSQRPGITLLEIVIAGSMLAMVMTSLSVVLRTSRTAWDANDVDYGGMHHAHAVTRHFVRQSREAKSVTALKSTSVSLEMQDGSVLTWEHAPGSKNGYNDAVIVTSSATGEQSAIAYDIRKLTFTGYEADGVKQTTVLNDIRLIQISAQVSLPRGNGATQIVSSKVWIRSW